MKGVTASDRMELSQLVTLISATIGQERGEELVREVAETLGVRVESMSYGDAEQVLSVLGERPGVVGLSARFARTRFRFAPRTRAGAQIHETSDNEKPGTLSRSEIVAMMEQALGREKSHQVVEDAAADLGIAATVLDRGEALEVLELLIATRGLVGVTARFAKVRLLMGKLGS